MNPGVWWRTLAHLRPAQILHRLAYRTRVPFFRFRTGVRPFETLRLPPRAGPGNAERGRALAAGRYEFVGQTLAFDPVASGWFPDSVSPLWHFHLHDFDWLKDLAAAGAADAARRLVLDWLRRYGRFHRVAWHPYPLSLRLVAWLQNSVFLLEGSDSGFREAYLQGLARQAAHLPHVLERDVGGNHLVKNIKALAFVGYAIPGRGRDLERAGALLEREIDRQIHPDGGHYEHSPWYHLQVLRDLQDLDALFRESDVAPHNLAAALPRMSGALAFFRHGDGRLALFNDGAEGEAPEIKEVWRQTGSVPPAPVLPETGYARLTSGATLVLFDAGHPCPPDLPAHAHADYLSLELSRGAERVVVNCGTYAYQDPELRPRLRGTAAHSTVCVDEEDSVEVWSSFRAGRRARHVALSVSSDASGWRARGSHDGYRHLGGVVHERRIHLSSDGATLEGEDLLRGRGPHDAAARFHLHPDVAVRRELGRSTLLLESSAGAWRFSGADVAPEIEASLYCPSFGVRRRTSQIVLRGRFEGARTFSWSFRRL